MFSDTCNVEGKKGLLWLDSAANFAVIANKWRHDVDRANKFAVVNPEEQWVDSVHTSERAAISRKKGLVNR